MKNPNSEPHTSFMKSSGSTAVTSAMRKDCARLTWPKVPRAEITTNQPSCSSVGHCQNQSAASSDSGAITEPM